MATKCPKCGCVLEVKLTAAPPIQAHDPRAETGPIGELLGQIVLSTLNEWEHEFIKSLSERYEEYGERTKLSAKQREILERIVNGE